jgi:hypothetical protein
MVPMRFHWLSPRYRPGLIFLGALAFAFVSFAVLALQQ